MRSRGEVSEGAQLQILARALLPEFERARGQFRISSEDAEDIRQETWLRFVRQEGRVRYPFAWLLHVFRNECRRFVVRRRFDSVLVDESSLVAPDSLRERPSLADALKPHLGALPFEGRKLLWQRYVAGMSPREIAKARGMRPATVRKALYRALRILKGRVPPLPG